jgi:hypothetical protein
MDKLIEVIKTLNKVYNDMQKSFDTLEKLFKKNSLIQQKILLTSQMANDIYRSIYNQIESDTINEEFIKIIKGIKDEKH